MKSIDVYQLIKETKIDEIFADIMSKKLNKNKNEIKNQFNDIIQYKLNKMGHQLTNEKVDESKFDEFKNLSLDDFLSDKIIIKEE